MHAAVHHFSHALYSAASKTVYRVCVCGFFIPSFLGISLRLSVQVIVPVGVTQDEHHTELGFPSIFCGARLDVYHGKGSAFPFPRRRRRLFYILVV